MSCPSRRCSPGCGCHDFSSRAAQLPSLVSIEVVGDLLFQAVRNTVRRAVSAAAGDMSPQEIDEADNRLVDWLGTTFSGGNPHYASGEDWNPRGLAVFLRDMISDELRETAGAVPEDNEEVVFAAAAVFLADLYRILNDLSRAGSTWTVSKTLRRLRASSTSGRGFLPGRPPKCCCINHGAF